MWRQVQRCADRPTHPPTRRRRPTHPPTRLVKDDDVSKLDLIDKQLGDRACVAGCGSVCGCAEGGGGSEARQLHPWATAPASLLYTPPPTHPHTRPLTRGLELAVLQKVLARQVLSQPAGRDEIKQVRGGQSSSVCQPRPVAVAAPAVTPPPPPPPSPTPQSSHLLASTTVTMASMRAQRARLAPRDPSACSVAATGMGSEMPVPSIRSKSKRRSAAMAATSCEG